MCMMSDKKDADNIKIKEHLIVIGWYNGYGIMKDEEFDLYYFARIDKHFKPLKLYDGSFEKVNAMYGHYVSTGHLLWAILEDKEI